MMRQPLPVSLPPIADELFSSWVARHAKFYSVKPLEMLHHCLPEIASLRTADMQLTVDQVRRLSMAFSTDQDTILRMTFSDVSPSFRRLITTVPGASCANCDRDDSGIITRRQLSGWRITCPVCGSSLRGIGDRNPPCPFNNHWPAALQGERLFDAEAVHAGRSWASPVEIARLLLMRRRPSVLDANTRFERFRVLGALIPELDDVIAEMRVALPSPASPILPLHLRPALLAGVAIVERSGPAMIEMLQSRLIGENRSRFAQLAGSIVASAQRARPPMQLHLI